ncbi:ArnT family glycosyltransferase [Patescibacteria group bacterium]
MKIIKNAISFNSFFLRVYKIETNPPSLYWDEASIGYEAYSISQTGNDMHGNNWFQAIFPAYGDYKAPIYIWLTSLSIKLLGVSQAAVRVPSVIFGTLTILVVYLLAKKLFKNENASLYSSIFLAFLPGHIQFSRAGFEANLAVFFIALFIYLLQLGVNNNKKIIIFASIPALMATYSYFSARIVIPLALIVWFFSNYKKVKKIIIPTLLLSAVFVIGLIPLFRSPYYNDANILRLSTDSILNNHEEVVYSNLHKENDQNSIISRIIHHRYLYSAKELLLNIGDHFEPNYLFFSGDENPRHSTGFSGTMLPAYIIIFLFGIIDIFKNKKTSFYLLGLWLIFLIPASVPEETPHALRSLNSTIPISLILGMGLNNFMKKRKTVLQKLLKNIYLVLIVINFVSYYFHLTNIYPKEQNLSWQDGYPQLAKYVKQNYKNYDYTVITPGDRLFLYTLYYSEFDPISIQNVQKDEIRKEYPKLSITNFGKVTFKPIVWEDDQRAPTSTLFIGLPADFPEGVTIKNEIKDINGQTQFLSVDMRQQ